MQRDCDSMAQQSPYYYIFTSNEFFDPAKADKEKFFESSRVDVDNILAALHVKPNPSWSVLDIGCGLGRTTRRLSELLGHTVGIDISKEMVKRAQEFTPAVHFQQTSGVDLKEFKDASFDLVFSLIVYQHLPSQKLVLNYLSETARVLKPGGLTLFQLPTSYFPQWKCFYWKLILRKKHVAPNRNRVSFRGIRLNAEIIQKHAFRLGLIPEIVLFEGTYYTYFRFAKGDAPSIDTDIRKAGESRLELMKLIR